MRSFTAPIGSTNAPLYFLVARPATREQRGRPAASLKRTIDVVAGNRGHIGTGHYSSAEFSEFNGLFGQSPTLADQDLVPPT